MKNSLNIVEILRFLKMTWLELTGWAEIVFLLFTIPLPSSIKGLEKTERQQQSRNRVSPKQHELYSHHKILCETTHCWCDEHTFRQNGNVMFHKVINCSSLHHIKLEHLSLMLFSFMVHHKRSPKPTTIYATFTRDVPRAFEGFFLFSESKCYCPHRRVLCNR